MKAYCCFGPGREVSGSLAVLTCAGRTNDDTTSGFGGMALQGAPEAFQTVADYSTMEAGFEPPSYPEEHPCCFGH